MADDSSTQVKIEVNFEWSIFFILNGWCIKVYKSDGRHIVDIAVYKIVSLLILPILIKKY